MTALTGSGAVLYPGDIVAHGAGDSLAGRYRGDEWNEGAAAGRVGGCNDIAPGSSSVISQANAVNQMEAVIRKGRPAFKVNGEGGTVAKLAAGTVAQFTNTGDMVVLLIAGEWEKNDTTSSPGQIGPFGTALFEPLWLSAMPASYPYVSIRTQSAGLLAPNLPAETLTLDTPHLLHSEIMVDRARIGLDGVYADVVVPATGGCLAHSYAKIGAADPATDIIAYYYEFVILRNPTVAQTYNTSRALALTYNVGMA